MSVRRMAGHTFGRVCPACPGEHGGPGRCDQVRYSPRWERFVALHAEAHRAALEDPGAASHEMERLRREYVMLPSGHLCTCRCPNEARGFGACLECQRLRRAAVRQDVAREIGRTTPVHAPAPDAMTLDLT